MRFPLLVVCSYFAIVWIKPIEGYSQAFQSSPSGNYAVSQDSNLKLPCVVRNLQGECLWIKDGRAIGRISNKYEFERQPQNGDCSLTIRNANYPLDDGQWQCQVTSINLGEESLQSDVVGVTVLIAPGTLEIERPAGINRMRRFNSENSEIKCSLPRGNPMPVINWFLNDRNVTDKAATTSVKIGDIKPIIVNTISVLSMKFEKEDNNATLKCVSNHPLSNSSDFVTLDILYPPEVRLSQERYTAVEGTELAVNCSVDSNPPATVYWKRAGLDSVIPSDPRLGPRVLYFPKISRDLNNAAFECSAQNEHGQSNPARVVFNILYAPRVLNISSAVVVHVGTEAHLYCYYDGNPRPVIRWYHINPRTGETSFIGTPLNEPHILNIRNVSYAHEGEYFCEAVNHVNNVDNIVRSGYIEVDVLGAPQFLTERRKVSSEMGEESKMSLSFCSDPSPYKVYWQFGSIKLEVNLAELPLKTPNVSANGRFTVHPLSQIQPRRKLQSMATCYTASLWIKDADISDQRDYILVVENRDGMKEGVVELKVVKPLSAPFMVATLFCIIILILVVSIIGLLFVRQKRRGKERVCDEDAKEDAQVLSQNHSKSNTDLQDEKVSVKVNGETNNQELVYANLDFPKDSNPPPTRPKPQMRPSHTVRPANSNAGTEYAKLAFPNKADL